MVSCYSTLASNLLVVAMASQPSSFLLLVLTSCFKDLSYPPADRRRQHVQPLLDSIELISFDLCSRIPQVA